MSKEARTVEKEAYALLEKNDHDEAFKSFKKAAQLYKSTADHTAASLCYASAASCWARRQGEKTFSNAAEAYEEGAAEAKKAGDLEYASLLYKNAAINYERDLEFTNFSECFYASRECYRAFLAMRIFEPGRARQIHGSGAASPVTRSAGFVKWLLLSFSFLFWGHGERPFRTLFFAIALIGSFALAYTRCHLSYEGAIVQPGLFNALYFSAVTFTTVGFGDFVPIGLARIPVMLEAFCGVFTVSLFVVSLSRKYLRI